ncbi:MAG: ABC transporter ATP-binding protein [Alphaproteobacteria bacterium]|jgi:branched-chain amino acid transport system ATP-binding protein
MSLALHAVESCYGDSQVLFGMELAVAPGEVATLLGRNGMGKTTTVRAIMGLQRVTGGEIRFHGERLDNRPAHRVARAGIGLVPEGRQIFPNLTVRENLVATASQPKADTADAGGRWTFERVLALFPSLGARLGSMGNQLSGGEQQMLAIGRALMTNPRLLILDDATEGLAPLVRDEIWRCLDSLKSVGQSILVIDKNVAALARIADRHHIVEKGRIVWTGDSAALMADPDLQTRYLGV